MAKILVVDDEIKIREIIKEYAEFEGYEVAQAEDGMQAVEMVKNQPIRTSLNNGSMNNKLNCDYSFMNRNSISSNYNNTVIHNEGE